MREESMLTRLGKFSRIQRTDLEVTLVPSSRICLSLRVRQEPGEQRVSTPVSVTCLEKLMSRLTRPVATLLRISSMLSVATVCSFRITTQCSLGREYFITTENPSHCHQEHLRTLRTLRTNS